MTKCVECLKGSPRVLATEKTNSINDHWMYIAKIYGVREPNALTLNKMCIYVFILVESWLTTIYSDDDLGFNDFLIFRCDCSSNTSIKAKGGGVVIVICRDISPNVTLTSFCTYNGRFKKIYLWCSWYSSSVILWKIGRPLCIIIGISWYIRVKWFLMWWLHFIQCELD